MDNNQPEKKLPDPKFTARARVQLTVEVYCAQPWSMDATLAELIRTAEREALERVESKIGNLIMIIGKPRVVAMFHAEEIAPR